MAESSRKRRCDEGQEALSSAPAARAEEKGQHTDKKKKLVENDENDDNNNEDQSIEDDVPAEDNGHKDSDNDAGDDEDNQDDEEEKEEGTEEEEDEVEYSGALDEDGEYTGHGVLTLKKSQVKYVGSFVKGSKHGPGELFFPDGSSLSGNFKDDSLWGPGIYLCKKTGIHFEGEYKDGILDGPGKETDLDGNTFFQGSYRRGMRHGEGVMFFKEGGRIRGKWKNGKVEGQATYYYPDNSTLFGTWKNGKMKKAHFSPPTTSYTNTSTINTISNTTSIINTNTNSSIINTNTTSNTTYSYDPSTTTRISCFPLRQDPYESQYTYTKDSSIPSSGEGLFMKQDVPSGFIVAMYGGMRISLKEGEKKPWDLKPNLICLDDDMCVDVPQELSDLSVYCATTGHKANHHWDNNSEYKMYYNHPIFGKIRCIRSKQPLKKDEEVTVDYGYLKGDGPLWYEHFMEGHWRQEHLPVIAPSNSTMTTTATTGDVSETKE